MGALETSCRKGGADPDTNGEKLLKPWHACQQPDEPIPDFLCARAVHQCQRDACAEHPGNCTRAVHECQRDACVEHPGLRTFDFNDNFDIELNLASDDPAHAHTVSLYPPGGLVLLHVGDISESYSMQTNSLSWGTFGDVTTAVHLRTSTKRAVKSVNKQCLRRFYPQIHEPDINRFVSREVDVLKQLDHPNILRVYEAFDNDEYCRVVLEFCEGGTLAARIAPSCPRLAEHEAAALFTQMLAAVQHLHFHGFVHRDLKPDNFMFAQGCSKDAHFSIAAESLKLIDFGLGRRLGVDSNALVQGSPSTKNYKAPEAQSGHFSLEHGDRVDIWALGVILHIIFLCELPAHSFSAKLRLASPKAVGVGHISASGCDLLEQLLNVEPLWRPSAMTAMKHPWCAAAARLTDSDFAQGSHNLISRFAGSSRFRRFSLVVVAHVMDDHDTAFGAVRQLFHALEFECGGAVTRQALGHTEGATWPTTRMAKELLRYFESVDIDGSGSITWSEFVSIFFEIAGTDLASTAAAFHGSSIPAIIVNEDTCRRAFDLLSNGTKRISSTTLRELFFPTHRRRALSYEIPGKSSSNRLVGVPDPLKRERNCLVHDILVGSLDFEVFMKMLRGVEPTPPEPVTPRAVQHHGLRLEWVTPKSEPLPSVSRLEAEVAFRVPHVPLADSPRAE